MNNEYCLVNRPLIEKSTGRFLTLSIRKFDLQSNMQY